MFSCFEDGRHARILFISEEFKDIPSLLFYSKNYLLTWIFKGGRVRYVHCIECRVHFTYLLSGVSSAINAIEKWFVA